MFHCHPCIFPCVFLNLWSQERVRTWRKDEFWSNLARFGSRNVRLAGLSEQLHEFFRALFLKRNDFLDKYEDWHPYLNTRQSHSHCLWLAQTCLWIHDYLSSAPTQVTKLFSITSQDSSTSQISEPGLHSQEAEISTWGWRNGKRWPKLWVWKHVQNACVKQCSRCAREKQVQNIGVRWNI